MRILADGFYEMRRQKGTGWKALMAAAVLCLSVCVAGGSGARAQQSPETFTIHDVPVDASAASSAQAREIAIANGERAAIQRLFDGMVLKRDQPFLPSLDASQIAGLVDGISVSDEKVSSTRYLAKMTVYFKPADIRSLLQRAGIAFSETMSKPVLILPVLETDGFATLWTDPNPWMAAWQAYDQTDSHVPFMLPKGGAEVAASLSADDVITGDPDTITKLAAASQVTDAYLAYARLYRDPYSGELTIRAQFLRFGEKPAVLGDEVVGVPADALPADRLTALMTSAVKMTVGDLNDEWKRQTLVHYGAEVSLPVTVPVAKLSDWLQIKHKLEMTPVIRNVSIRSMTIHEARIAISYLGNQQQLALALAQSDLQLTQDGAGDWLVTQTDTQASK